jgi:hypothetical protein
LPELRETIPLHHALKETFSERKVTFTLQYTDGEWVASRIIISQPLACPCSYYPNYIRSDITLPFSFWFNGIIFSKLLQFCER